MEGLNSGALPAKVLKKRATMDEPSDDRSLDRTCRCGQKLWYIGIKWHKVTFEAFLHHDEDGEPVYGDRTAPAPYSYWMCADGHVETDGY